MSTFLRLGFLVVLVGAVGWLIYVRRLWHTLHVLWVCRVSVLSAIGGGALITLTEQSRDLFADLGLSLWQWLAFFVLLCVWALVVHLVGRRSLQSDYWVPEAHGPGGLSEGRRQELQQEYGAVTLWVPRLLGLSIFFFVGIALYDAQQNLAPARGLDEANEAHDHLVWLFVATVATALIFLLLVWNRRKAEARIAYGNGARDEQPPLLIGLAPFPRSLVTWSKQGPAAESKLVWSVHLVMLFMALCVTAALVAAIVLPHDMAETFPRAQIVPILFGSIVIVLGELVLWSYRSRTPWLLALAIVAVVALFWADRFHDVRFVGNPAGRGKADGQSAQITFDEAVARWKSVNCRISDGKEECPRPILFAGAGGASRAAFATATVVGALFDRGPDIRNRVFAMSTVSGSSVGAVIMRAAMADAAESGNPDRPPCRKRPGQHAWFGNLAGTDRFRTAPDFTKSWRDCFQFLLAGDFLSATAIGLVYRDNFPVQIAQRVLWDDRAALLEESLERRYNIVTADKFEHCSKEDNRGLCRRFGFHPHPRVIGNAWIPLLFVNGTSVATGRRIIAADVPIGKAHAKGVLLPFAYDVNEIRNWRARRSENDRPEAEQISFCRMPFEGKSSQDMSMAQRQSAAIKAAIDPATTIDNCFRLSTASMLSARFPVISPQGNLRDRSDDIRDKVVDGGYFENDALATLADVAQSLRANGLHPVAIRVLNHPEPREGKKDLLGPDRPSLPNEDERAFFDDVLSIVRTLSTTRSGHEDGHEAYLKDSLSVGQDENKGFAGAAGKDRLYEFRVYELKPESAVGSKERQLTQKQQPQRNVLCRRNVSEQKIGKTVYMETVSMSWWMSHPVQAYLDAQLCVEANWGHLECELERGRLAPGGSCAGEPLKAWLSGR